MYQKAVMRWIHMDTTEIALIVNAIIGHDIKSISRVYKYLYICILLRNIHVAFA